MADYPELKLLINGEWISRPGQPVINPADETTHRHGAACHHGRPRRCRRRGRAGLQGLAQHVARQARRDHPEGGRHHAPARRGDGGGHDARAGQADRAIAPGGAARLRHHRVGRAGGPPHLRPHHSLRARHAPHRAAPADRAGRRLLAVELPREFSVTKNRRRTVGRLLDHPQGLRGDARRRLSAGALLRRCRLARRACSTCCTAIRPPSRNT